MPPEKGNANGNSYATVGYKSQPRWFGDRRGASSLRTQMAFRLAGWNGSERSERWERWGWGKVTNSTQKIFDIMPYTLYLIRTY
jgi:hypothetical protein